MEENTTHDKSQNPDFELCGACGAVLEKGSKFCKRCGAKIEAVKPEVAPVEEKQKDDAPVEPPEKRCSNCGEVLGETVKFCHKCGTAVSSAEPPAEKFCMGCGAKLDEGVKFCKKCGTAVGGVVSATNANAPSAEETADKQTAKKRKVSAILYLVGAALSVLFGFIFLCTPFLSLELEVMGIKLGSMMESMGYGGVGASSQNGLTLIGCMFGASSDLVQMGVNSTLLSWAGWLTLAFIVGMVDHCVCLALNVSRYKKGERPYNILQSNGVMLLAGFGLLIVGCIAVSQANDWLDMVKLAASSADSDVAAAMQMVEFSSYLGFVGVFVMSLVGFGTVTAAYVYSSKTFPPRQKKIKKTGNILKIFITDVVCGVLIGVAALAPIFGAFGNYDDEITVRVGDSGSAGVKCDEKYGGSMAGTTIFKMEGLEYGKSYVFRIETNDVGQAALVGSVFLVEYDDVKGKNSAEIVGSLGDIYIDVNDSGDTGSGYAQLPFTYKSSKDYAIVVAFVATGEMSIKYDYSLKAK